MLALLKTLAAFSATAPFFGSVRDCAPGSSIFTVNSVSLDPATPVPGQSMTLNLDYTVPYGTTVNGGQVEYAITYNYIPFQPSYEPLCQDIPCPLGPGTYTNASTSVWPAGVSGLVVSQMKWYDDAADLLLCIEISGQVGDLDKVAMVRAPPQLLMLGAPEVAAVAAMEAVKPPRTFLRGLQHTEEL
jgi:hypothetical protein